MNIICKKETEEPSMFYVNTNGVMKMKSESEYYLALLDEVEKELKRIKFTCKVEDGYPDVILWDDVVDVLITIDKKHAKRIRRGLKEKRKIPLIPIQIGEY